jgi:hypothetical protein
MEKRQLLERYGVTAMTLATAEEAFGFVDVHGLVLVSAEGAAFDGCRLG